MNADEQAYVERFVKAGFGTEGQARTAWESEQAGAASTLPAPPDTDPQLPYEEFLEKKTIATTLAGFEPATLTGRMFPFQRDICRWGLRRGKGAVFANTGLGKSLIELEWATRVVEHTGGRLLIFAPLAVAKQLVQQEAAKFGYSSTVAYARTPEEATTPIVVTNYDRLHLFKDEEWSGVVLDESSILKSLDGKLRTALIEAFAATPYKLAATATPAPNDYTELGNHAEFLGVMTRAEMLAMFFAHNGGSTQDWKLKGHARSAFWQWVASWAVVVNRPSDVNQDYDDTAFVLPPIEYHHHVVPADPDAAKEDGKLFLEPARGLNDQRKARRDSIADRVKVAAEIVTSIPTVPAKPLPPGVTEEPLGMLAGRLTEAGFCGHSLPMISGWTPEQRAEVSAWLSAPTSLRPGVFAGLTRELEPALVWCDLNQEADDVTEAIGPGAEQVAGTDDPDDKERKLFGFINGAPRVLVTKAKIGGFGLNYQHAARAVFLGVSHSWEAFYQCVRRQYRFGQKRKVDVHIVTSELEGEVVANLKRKEEDAQAMAEEMVSHVRETMRREIGTKIAHEPSVYESDTRMGDGWTVHLGDCVDWLRRFESASIDFCVASPPFIDLYVYSATERDFGNCQSDDEFMKHMAYLVPQLRRTIKPGRLVAWHTMMVPTKKSKEGFIGLKDFPGMLTRIFESHGFILHSRVVIWKDPVVQMHRSHALGLLHKTIRKDSSMCRMGIPDELIVWRAPGENIDPITHWSTDPVTGKVKGDPAGEEFQVETWQRYASPVWMDIDPGDTLQRESAREHEDERHVAPLQLEVIRRAIRLWSKPGDLVFSPFTGIGSEGYVSLQEGRRFLGTELKRSYWQQACANLDAISRGPKKQIGLFDEVSP